MFIVKPEVITLKAGYFPELTVSKMEVIGNSLIVGVVL